MYKEVRVERLVSLHMYLYIYIHIYLHRMHMHVYLSILILLGYEGFGVRSKIGYTDPCLSGSKANSAAMASSASRVSQLRKQ